MDPERRTVPISSTAIRSDPYRYRRFLHPSVYRDYLTTVVFLGAPCTGKTTLAERLAQDLGTVWAPEYGREYWERHQVDRRLRPEQLVEIAEGHLQREDALILDARRFFFVDTNALTTTVFARYYHGAVDPRLAAVADSCPPRYDLMFLCEDDFPNEDTWDRSGPVNRALMQRMVIDDLAARGIDALRLSGPVELRAEAVKRVLHQHRKWDREDPG